jgi:hypothetical protein
MRRALRIYQKDYQQLRKRGLTWPEFERLADQCREEAITALGEDEPPWSPDDAIAEFVESLSKRRKEASESWTKSLEDEVAQLRSLAVADVSRMHSRASNPPAVLTVPHVKRVKKIVEQIETRLDALKIEWLLEKFRELSGPLQKKFMSLFRRGEVKRSCVCVRQVPSLNELVPCNTNTLVNVSSHPLLHRKLLLGLRWSGRCVSAAACGDATGAPGTADSS